MPPTNNLRAEDFELTTSDICVSTDSVTWSDAAENVIASGVTPMVYDPVEVETPSVQAEMVLCQVDNIEIPKTEAVGHEGCYYAKEYRNTHCICIETNTVANRDDCVQTDDSSEWILESEIDDSSLVYRCNECDRLYKYGKFERDGKSYCEECKDETFYRCEGCEEYYERGSETRIHNDEYRCENCMDYFIQCEGCSGYFHEDDLEYDEDEDRYYCFDCGGTVEIKDIETTDYDTDIKEGQAMCCPVKGAPYDAGLSKTKLGLGAQAAEGTNKKVKEFLDEWYGQYKEQYDTLYKHKDIKEKFNVSLQLQSESKVGQYIKDIISFSKRESSTYKKQNYRNKYSSYKFKRIENLVAEYDCVSIFGKNKVVKEPAIKFYKYIAELYGNNLFGDVDITMFQKDSMFQAVMSNDVEHKIGVLNDGNAFNSCQTPNNCGRHGGPKGYARGAYDLLANGCNAPILIYEDKKLVGRLLTRLMYTKDKKEYLFVDRLYSKGALAKNKNIVYSQIVAALIDKGYDVVVSGYSVHDTPVQQYLERNNHMKLKFKPFEQILRQPIRKLGREDAFGYYHDSGTRTYINTKGEAYDVMCKKTFLVTK